MGTSTYNTKRVRVKPGPCPQPKLPMGKGQKAWSPQRIPLKMVSLEERWEREWCGGHARESETGDYRKKERVAEMLPSSEMAKSLRGN